MFFIAKFGTGRGSVNILQKEITSIWDMPTFWRNANKFVTFLNISFLNNSPIFNERLGFFKYFIVESLKIKRNFVILYYNSFIIYELIFFVAVFIIRVKT